MKGVYWLRSKNYSVTELLNEDYQLLGYGLPDRTASYLRSNRQHEEENTLRLNSVNQRWHKALRYIYTVLIYVLE